MQINAKKTQCVVFNHQDDVTIKTSTGAILEVVEYFKYLGSWTQSSSNDISTREAQAWRGVQQTHYDLEIKSTKTI